AAAGWAARITLAVNRTERATVIFHLVWRCEVGRANGSRGLHRRPVLSNSVRCGGMAEWSMAVVLKTTVGETPPGVRIPLPPPNVAWLATLRSRLLATARA